MRGAGAILTASLFGLRQHGVMAIVYRSHEDAGVQMSLSTVEGRLASHRIRVRHLGHSPKPREEAPWGPVDLWIRVTADDQKTNMFPDNGCYHVSGLTSSEAGFLFEP
jgi:hypothetical protein